MVTKQQVQAHVFLSMLDVGCKKLAAAFDDVTKCALKTRHPYIGYFFFDIEITLAYNPCIWCQ